ncbi:MAG: ABC transporter substrate-binding protein [Hyphomicrobiaceae bacterium]|nr:ABC transporter substrate-binding protein [Hyphomicrobiaceae bacterium]
MISFSCRSALSGVVSLGLFIGSANAETIELGIGHQSTVTNTVPGGVILEKLGLLDKHLPKDGKYAGVTYKIEWQDHPSGPPITNQMLAGKLQFGVMGDYPLIVNGANFQKTGKVESRFIMVTGYNLKGTGNGIVVPVASDVYSLEQLAGKKLSTPIGSAAWGMTLKVLRDRGLYDKIEILGQSPPIGVTNIAQNKIDAHANFCPWSEVMEFRGTGRKIFDGSEAGIPTFHGTVVLKDFAEKYPEIVQAYVNATMEAQAWIAADPFNAAVKVSEWTGIEKEVLYLYFSKGGISTFEGSIKPQWVEALKYDHGLLAKEREIPPLDFDRWIDATFVKKGFAAKKLDYDAAVKSVVSPSPDLPGLKPAELWIDGQGIVAFDSVAAMVDAHKAAKSGGKKVLASYVYDKSTGLKLFGHVAYFVRGDKGELTPFMKKSEAEAFAASAKGQFMLWTQVS